VALPLLLLWDTRKPCTRQAIIIVHQVKPYEVRSLPYCLPGSIRDFLRHRGDRDKHAPTLLQKESVVRRVALSHALPQRARVHRRRRTRASWLLGSFETSCHTLCSHLMATSILKFYWGSASTSGAVCNTENRKHPEALFDVVLNTNRGCERHRYRFWLYADRTEWRLRMDHETIDLSTPNGGDLLVINKLSTKIDNDSLYKVTILPRTDPIEP